ncbi:MAG: transporter substrate-binding domain-containing protein [Variibacter sp.]|nr:transporter substrate-binding domain-containing protein [Variibacter sp.]
MGFGWTMGVAVALLMGGAAMAQDKSAVLKELAPTGKLRVGIAVGPTGSPLWAIKDPKTGKPAGVTVDLGAALAAKLGVPVEYVVYPSSGEITNAVDRNEWDVGFMPVDDERKKIIAFGPNYSLGESTYMVGPGSAIRKLADIDKPGVRVVGVENTTTIRAARRLLKHATVTGTKGSGETFELLKAGKADAIALGRDSLEDFAAMLPGSHVLEEHFWAVGTAIAVARNKPAALAYVTEFIEAAKADGTVKKAFDAAKLRSAKVAPAGSRS